MAASQVPGVLSASATVTIVFYEGGVAVALFQMRKLPRVTQQGTAFSFQGQRTHVDLLASGHFAKGRVGDEAVGSGASFRWRWKRGQASDPAVA